MEKVDIKNPANNAGWTPLHSAADRNHLDVCRLIIENVNNKNPADNYGQTLLHSAALSGHFDICQLIMEHVDNKNPTDNDGNTPKDFAKGRFDRKLNQLFET